MNVDESLAIARPSEAGTAMKDKFGLAMIGMSILAFLVILLGGGPESKTNAWLMSFGLLTLGTIVMAYNNFGKGKAGIQNDGIMFRSITSKGTLAWILGIVLTGFYIILYWFPAYLENLIRICDPMSYMIRGRAADQWFLYGSLYTIAVVAMGYRAILKYRHNRYQIIRTISVMFFQLGFAFLIPAFLLLLNQPEFYFSYFWPLKYSYLFPSDISYLVNSPGGLGIFMVFWGALMSFLATPILTYFYGKRWYCSWVCGCGGLAETLGDPFRHQSDKSLKAWKIERWMIYSVLVFVIVTTALLWINSVSNGSVLGSVSEGFSKSYGFLIGAVFSGVVGVGFYPIMGSRVWCRFGCPMAAYLGIIQKYFSRFRITTNGGQCISCGNCSTYCEMGIDVRSYAQKGQNIIRASCVGCGICSAVCPRGVLNLENGSIKNRYNEPIHITKEGLSLSGNDEQ